MERRARRILMLSFLVFFLVASPVLILYSLGYKYNWQKNRLEKTGVFFIKSFPKDARIYLDGELLRKKTPTQVTRLLAKNYQVEIAKDGYHSWKKTLGIESQMTTFIEDVSLFKQEVQPEKLISGDFTGFLASPSRQMIALVDETDEASSLWVYNLISDDFTRLYSTKPATKLEILSWSHTDRKLIVRENNAFVIINVLEPDYRLRLAEITSLRVNRLKWHELNDNLLIAESNQRLYQIDIIAKEVKKLSNEVVEEYEPYKNDLVYIANDSGNYYLKKINGSDLEVLFSLPYSTDYQFSKAQDYLVLSDRIQKVIYLLKPGESQPVKSIIKNVDSFSWHENRLVYWNKAELWAYYPESKEGILLERTSQNISYGFWHPNATYVFGESGGSLKIYELDGRDQRNIHELVKLPENNRNFILTDKKGNNLYLVTEYNGEPGFYKAQIQ